MGKEEKTTVVPRLRFPEFREAEGWVQKPLEALLLPVVREREKPSEFYTGLGVRSHGKGTFLKPHEIPEKNSMDRLYEVYTDDLIVNITFAWEGAIAIAQTNDNGALVSHRFPTYTFRTESTLAKFFRYSILDKKLIYQLGVISPGGAGRNRVLNKRDFLKLTRFVPKITEQQKIADCLTSLDELISTQGKKVEALKTYKRGLMQQLFPREGETLPRLRFPEFHDAPEWEEVALGEIAEIKLGKMLDSQKHTTGRLLPYLNNVSLRWNDVDTSNLPQMYFNDGELDRYGLKLGDVVVCEGGEPGRSAVWDGRLPDLKFQKAIHRVRFNVPFEPRLLVLYLEAIAGTTRFEMLFTGGGIKHLTRETFAQLNIPFIPLAEQQRVVDCLSSLDAQITSESEKLDILKTHKKGLMQQLFPTLLESVEDEIVF